MNRDEAIKLLNSGKKGIREWNRWRASAQEIPDLNGVILPKSNLRRVNFHKAHLSGAVLSEANLSEADLSEADLSEANLSRANLRGAKFFGAKCSHTLFGNVDLSDVKGL